MCHCEKEDFSVWYPCFDTCFTYETTGKKRQTGPYEILYDTKLLNAEAYTTDHYSLFHSGNVADLRIVNHRIPEQFRKKILFVKDSFANALVPLMALQTYEIHEIDPRSLRALDIEETIKKEKPDIVIFFM